MRRAIAVTADTRTEPVDVVTLPADERHMRRRALSLRSGEVILADLPIATRIRHGERLVLEDGAQVLVEAAVELLVEARAGSPMEFARLAWRIGNCHAPVAIFEDTLRIVYDPVLRAMLEAAGAQVRDIEAPFDPDPALSGGQHHHASHGHGGH